MLRRLGGRVDVLDLSRFLVKVCLTIACAATLLFVLSSSVDFGHIYPTKIVATKNLSSYYAVNAAANHLLNDTHSSQQKDIRNAEDATNNDDDKINEPSDTRQCFLNAPKHNGRCGFTADIVESMKSGTTGLWSWLHQHPNIGGLSVHCDFTDYDRCLSINNSGGRKIVIDKGPDGPRCKPLVERMHAVAPDMKLIFLFRHPIDRLYSHYQHQVRSSVIHYNNTFEVWVQRELKMSRCFDLETQSWLDCFTNPRCSRKSSIAFSAYADLIELYSLKYPRDQMYILITEELYANPQKHMDDLMAWLGLDSFPVQPPRNANVRSYQALDRAFGKELYLKYFDGNVKRLEALLGRKLPWTA